MEIEITCPSCGQAFCLEHDGQSGVVNCPFCNAELELEAPPTEPARPSPPRPARLAHPRLHADLPVPHRPIPHSSPPKPSASPVELFVWLLVLGAGLGAGWWWWTRRAPETESAAAPPPPPKQTLAAKPITLPSPPPAVAPSPSSHKEGSPALQPAAGPPFTASARPAQELSVPPATLPAPSPPPVPEPAASVLPPPPAMEEAATAPQQSEAMKPQEEEPPPEPAQPKQKGESEVKLTSPGFETLEDWNIVRTSGLVRPMTDAAHSGNRGLRITDSSRTAGTIVSYTFPSQPGDVYRCSFWARVISGSVATVSLRFVDAKGQVSGNSVVIPATCKTWTEFSVTATAPQQTKEGEIWIATPEAETVVVDLDDFRLLRTR